MTSVRHSMTGSTDMESSDSETSFGSTLTTVSSLYENSLTSLTSELGPQSLEGGNTVSSEENMVNSSTKGSASNFEGQPDLICEVGICGSQQPDLVSSQEILRSCSPGCSESLDPAGGSPVTQKLGKKKKRTTHKYIKSRVKAMINKGKLKLSDSIGRKKKSVLAAGGGVEGTFNNSEVDEINGRQEIMTEMKRNLTALLNDEQDEIKQETNDQNQNSEDEDVKMTMNAAMSRKESDKQETIKLQEESTNPETTPEKVPKFEEEHAKEKVEEMTTNSLDDLLDINTNENVKQLQRRYSRRKKWNSAQKPDVESLLSRETLSLADSLEGATYMSSYSCTDYIDGEEDLEPEIIEEIRINKIKWKQVVAQIKDQCSSNQKANRRSSLDEDQTTSITVTPCEKLPPINQVAKTLEIEFDDSRLTVSQRFETEVECENSPRKMVSPKPVRKAEANESPDDKLNDHSPNSSKDSDDYFVIATPEKKTTESETSESEATFEKQQEPHNDYALISNGANLLNVDKGETKAQSDTQRSPQENNQEKKSKVPKFAQRRSRFGLSPLLDKAKDKFMGSTKKYGIKDQGVKESEKSKETKDDSKLRSKPGNTELKQPPVKKRERINHKDDSKKSSELLDKNDNLRDKERDRNFKDLATELAEATETNPEKLNLADCSPHVDTLKKAKTKSPKGSKTADLIRKDHASVMQILASRTLVSYIFYLHYLTVCRFTYIFVMVSN